MKNMEKLVITINDLISLGVEGEYWDFKEYPYFYSEQDKEKELNKKADLLHDILCMANNLSNETAYIIMGVSDDGKIKGLNECTGRWNQSEYIKFLKDKKFSGEYRPSVELCTIELDSKEIDVLIIHKSPNIPFYLAEKPKSFSKDFVNKIYVRKGDTNTPWKEQANIHDIEKLWKIRLGLLPAPTPKERTVIYTKDFDGWKQMESTHQRTTWYYEPVPEFTLEHYDGRDASEVNPNFINFAYIQINSKSYEKVVRIKYHQTVLMELYCYNIDDTKGTVIRPNVSSFGWSENIAEYVDDYYYYLKDSVEFNLSKFFGKKIHGDAENPAWIQHLKYVCVFESEHEKAEFEKLINANEDKYKNKAHKLASEIVLGHEHNLDNSYTRRQYIKNDMAVSKMAKNALDDFRNNAII